MENSIKKIDIDSLGDNVKEAIFYTDFNEIRRLASEIEDIKNRNNDYYTKHQIVLSKLHLHCLLMTLSTQPSAVIENLLRTAMKESVNIPEFDLHERLYGFLIAQPSLAERDNAKKRFLQALLDNKENIGKGKKSPEGVIGNWLKEYNENLVNRNDATLTYVEFTSRREFMELSQKEKILLKNLFLIVEYLNLSSQNLESDTEVMLVGTSDGGLYEWRGGKIDEHNQDNVMFAEEQISNAGKNLDTTKKAFNQNQDPFDVKTGIDQNYTDIFTERLISKSVDQESEKSSTSRLLMPDVAQEFKKLTASRLESGFVVNQLHQTILQRNVVVSLAYLRFLADKGQLSTLLNDKRFVQLLLAKYRKEGNKEAEVSLLNNPNESYQLRNLLRMILEERLKLGENDSAYVASDLIGIARDKGEKVEHVAYYDEADEKYHWI